MNYIHRYLNYYKEAKQTFVEIKISQFTIHHIVFRYLSFYLTPLFLFLNMSDNQATFVRTIVGILSSFFSFESFY